jgi:hypothetical protein
LQYIKNVGAVCFSVLEEGRDPYTLLFPMGLAGGCFLVSASVSSCKLVVEISASRTGKALSDTVLGGKKKLASN